MPQQMAQVTANVVIAQASNPAPGGYASGSRDDITVGAVVTLTNADNTSATWHRWTITPYYPAGTLAGLSVTGDATSTCTLTPDIAGDVAVTLEVAGAPLPDGRANVARQTVMLGIRATLAGYAPGLPLPHPLEGSAGTSAAVDSATGDAGRIAEAIYALSQAAGGGGSGVLASLAWDTTQATDAAVGRYATFAEIVAAIGSTESPITVLLVGAPTTSGTATYDWPHVTFRSDDTAVTLTLTEGLVIKNAAFDMSGDVVSTATTTVNLLYSPSTSTAIRGGLSGGTLGLIGVDGAGTAQIRIGDGSTISTRAFHTAAGQTLGVYLGASEFEGGSVDHFEGTAGDIYTYRTGETIGEFEESVYSGTSTRFVLGTPEKIRSVTVDVAAPTAGQVLTATSGTAAEWSTPSAGVLSALTWDSSQAADLAVGRVQTFAELTAEIGTIESPISVQVVADANVNVAGTYAYSNVAFWSNDPAVTLTFNTNGVHVQDAKFSGLGLVNTSTNVVLDYTGNRTATFDGCALSGSTKGVFTFTATGSNTAHIIGGSTLDEYAFEQTVAADVVFVTENATYLGTGQFAGSLGTLTYKRTGATSGDPDLTHWSGAGPTYNTAQANALRIQGVTMNATTPTDGQVIQYDGEATEWLPSTLLSATFPPLLFKHAVWAKRINTAAINGDYSLGLKFMPLETCSCTGVQVWWKCSSGTASITVKLYDSSGTVLATQTQAVDTTATLYNITFASPVALSSYLGQKLTVAVYQTTGSAESYFTTTSNFQSVPYIIGPGILSWGNFYISGPGGGAPRTMPAVPGTGPATTELYGINPIITLADYPS